MALRQLVPIEITLLGDGATTTFTFPVANLVQNGTGGSAPPVAAGVIPSAVLIPNPPISLSGSPTIDANGNISFTFTAAPTNNQQYSFEVDLLFNSGAATSTSPTPGSYVVDIASMVGTVPGTAPGRTLVVGGIYNLSAPTPSTGQTLPFQLDASGNLNVNVKAGSSGNAAASATGSAVPASADYQGINVGGTLRGVTGFSVGSQFAESVAIVDASGNQIVSFGGNPATAGFANPGLTQAAAVQLSTDLSGNLRTRSRAETVLGDLTAMPRQNQVEVNFSQGFSAASSTNTLTGTGTATVTNGQAVFASGTTSGGRAIGQSTSTLSYRPGHEWYCYFTAAFSTGGTGTGFQRIGPYSSTDGFYLSYEGATVNFTQRQNSVDTHVARGSWNGDAATGAAGSQFTSGGSPVALNFQNLNIFRVHGAWFGASPVSLEAFSPDGTWVTLHTFRFPNTLTTPFAYTTSWPVTCDVQSNSATNVSISTPCWAMGVVNAVAGGTFNASAAVWNSGTTLNSAVYIPQSATYNTVGFDFIQTTPITGGIASFEASQDGTNWFLVPAISVIQQTVQTSYTFQASTNASFIVDITAWAFFRIRLSQVVNGAGTVTVQTGADPGNASINQVFGTISVSNMPAVSYPAAAIPASMLMAGGSDGTLSRFLLTDTSGRTITANLTTTGSAVPSYADYIGFNSGGNLVGVSAANPLPTTGLSLDLVGSTTPLNALNAAATVNASGYLAVGGFLAAGTLIGTIVAECSFDGGTTWVSTFFDNGNKPSSIVFASANPATSFSIIGSAGASNYRVRVSAFTSGTANCTLRANEIHDPAVNYSGLVAATIQPPTVNQVGGWVTTAAPAYSTGTFNTLSLDTAGNLRVNTFSPDTVGTLAALNALNAAATINAAGDQSIGGFLAAGTLIGTIVAEASFDGGTTWTATYFDTGNKPSTIVFASSNPATSFSIIAAAGASNYRVRVSAFTSGTANCTLRGNDVRDPTLLMTGLPASTVQPPTVGQMGGWVTTAAPAYSTTTLNTLSLTTGGGLRTDQSSQAGTAITTVPVAFGTGTPSGNAPGYNAAMYVGTTPVRSNQTTTATGVIDVNNVGIDGTTTVTAAAGVQRVGIAGNANATLDAAINTGAAPTNVLWMAQAPSTAAQAALSVKAINATAATVVKASAGNFYGIYLVNLATTTSTTTATVQYVHFFNTTTTTGLATTSWLFALPLPANPANVIGGGTGLLSIPPGSHALNNFSSGIVVLVATGSASTTTASGTAPVGVIWYE